MQPSTDTVEKRVSYKQYVSKSSPYYGLTAFWALEEPEELPAEGKAFALGLASLTLYILLFRYEGLITHFAALARQGQGVYFLLPVLIALLFSLVHGAFTSYFWNAMGIQPNDDEDRA